MKPLEIVLAAAKAGYMSFVQPANQRGPATPPSQPGRGGGLHYANKWGGAARGYFLLSGGEGKSASSRSVGSQLLYCTSYELLVVDGRADGRAGAGWSGWVWAFATPHFDAEQGWPFSATERWCGLESVSFCFKAVVAFCPSSSLALVQAVYWLVGRRFLPTRT
jgi:hypothetical protein